MAVARWFQLVLVSIVPSALIAACSATEDPPPNNATGGILTPGAGVNAAGGGGMLGTSGVGVPSGSSGNSGVPGTGAMGAPPTSNTGGSSGSGGADPTAGAGGAAPVNRANAWTMMGGDERNWYFNAAESTISAANAGTLTEKWRFMVAGYPAGSPVIAEGKVFVTATGGVYALDLMSGAKLWERTDITGTASPAYEAGFVYVHQQVGANLFKLDAADGQTVWGPKQSNATARCDGTSSPILGGGKVIVGFSCGVLEVTGGGGARGGFSAHDMESGDQLYQYFTVPETGEDGAMVWSSVGIDVEGGRVFAATGNNYSVAGANSDAIHAVDLMTGAGLWKHQVRENDLWPGGAGQDTDFGANPIVAEVSGTKVVANGDKGSAFWALNRETGDEIWSRQNLSASHTANNGGILMNGAFDGRYFYAVSNDPSGRKAVLHKMDPSMNGTSVWMKEFAGKVTWGAPSLANGVIYVPINDDLHVLDAESGDSLTMFATGGSMAAGAAAIAEGRVVVKSGLNYVFGLGDAINNNQVICYGLP
jgi:outer membrane protein assembly factor BamB